MEVRFESVIKRYGSFTAVRKLDLTIKQGALHFLLGPSGCGKTTTLRMLAGLETPSEGRILFNGKDITTKPAAERGIGMVFQNYALWPHMTVRKNVEYGLNLRKLTARELDERVREVLDFTQLGPFEERLPGQLSGGQQQRVALARALAIRPNVLLLDEPLSNLDAKLRLEMRDNISRIHKQTGITTVYVTHDQKEALSMGTEISVMRAGDLIQTDDPRKLYHAPSSPFIAGFIGETNLVEGRLTERRGDGFVVDTPLGRIAAAHAARSAPRELGSTVVVSFRPEAVQVDFGNAAFTGDNQLDLILEHLTYLGESEQLALRGGQGVPVKASVFNPPDQVLNDGDRVRCRVLPEDVLVLPVEKDLSSGT